MGAVLILLTAPNWRPGQKHVAAAASGGGGTPPPTEPTPTIPLNATWFYDEILVDDVLISEWNNAPTGISSPGVTLDLRPYGMPGKLWLKNAANKPRCVHSGTYKGALRGMRRSVGPFADPTGGPPDHDDNESIQESHSHTNPLNAAGDQVKPAYGQEFEYGFQFYVVSGAAGGYPNDGDASAWTSNEDLWLVLGALSAGSSGGDTCEMVGVYLRHYGAQFGVYPKTSRLEFINAGGITVKEYYDFWTPSGLKTNTQTKRTDGTKSNNWSPSILETADRIVINFNQWYTMRFHGMCAGWNDTRSWCRFYLNDTLIATAANLGMGKENESSPNHIRFGSYGSYKLYGVRRNYLMRKMWVRLGATGFPGQP